MALGLLKVPKIITTVLEIVTDTVANATNISPLATKYSGLIANDHE